MNNRPWWHSGAACLSALMWALFAVCMLITVLRVGNTGWATFTVGIAIVVAVIAARSKWGKKHAG